MTHLALSKALDCLYYQTINGEDGKPECFPLEIVLQVQQSIAGFEESGLNP